MKPRISVVLEWENVILSDAARATALLRELARQIRELQEPVEVLVVYGDDRIGGAALRRMLDDVGMEARLLPAPGCSYYELKNHGAERAAGDLVVFVDSDIALHANWLAHILEPFADDGVDVVGGHCYIEPAGFVAKAFAAFWIFPRRVAGEGGVAESRRFYANSVAFRREVFLRHRFPAIDGATRGSCMLLAENLRRSGIPVYRTTAAQVRHPPPNGLHHFVIRALAHGRDDVFCARASVDRRAARLGWSLLRIPRKARDVIRRRGAVGLSWPGTVAAAFLAMSFCTLRVAGNVLTRLTPGVTRRVWRI